MDTDLAAQYGGRDRDADSRVQVLPAALEPVLGELPTLVIAEGLLMYFTPERVNTLLREVTGLRVPRVRVVLTAMDTAEGEPISFRPRSRLADQWLARRAEPMKSSIPAGREREILGAAGLRHIRTITARELRGPDRPGLDGENILVSERP